MFMICSEIKTKIRCESCEVEMLTNPKWTFQFSSKQKPNEAYYDRSDFYSLA